MLQWGWRGGCRHVSDSTTAMLGRRGHSAPRVQGCRNGALCPLPFLCAPVLPMYPTNIYREPALRQALFQMLGSGGRHSLQHPWGATGTEGCFPAALENRETISQTGCSAESQAPGLSVET